MFVVEDALEDARFASNPLVTGAPGIRFYAGVPIALSPGHRIGALCVCDRRPRRFHGKDIERLRQFGKLAEASVAAHAPVGAGGDDGARCGRARRNCCGRRTGCCARSSASARSADGSSTSSPTPATGRTKFPEFTSCRSAAPISSRKRSRSIPTSGASSWSAIIEKALATGEPYDFEAQFVTALGNRKWVRAAGECEQQDGVPVRLFGMFQDITLEKEACRAAVEGRQLRRAHRARQSPALQREAGERHRGGRHRRARPRADAHRPRQLQGDQRYARA